MGNNLTLIRLWTDGSTDVIKSGFKNETEILKYIKDKGIRRTDGKNFGLSISEQFDAKGKFIKTKKPVKVNKSKNRRNKAYRRKKPRRNIARDKQLRAKKMGRRVSASGKVYYESRPNRSDRNPSTGLWLNHGQRKVSGSF